jgi:hypothetical protein
MLDVSLLSRLHYAGNLASLVGIIPGHIKVCTDDEHFAQWSRMQNDTCRPMWDEVHASPGSQVGFVKDGNSTANPSFQGSVGIPVPYTVSMLCHTAGDFGDAAMLARRSRHR